MSTNCCYDWEGDRSLCEAVVTAIAAVTGDEPTAIRPLYDTVDPDALARTFESARRARRDGDELSTTFRHHGCEVTVTLAGEVRVRPDGD